MNTTLNRNLKRKIAKTIEILVGIQHKAYISKFTDIQLRLETIYDTLHNDDIEVKKEKNRLSKGFIRSEYKKYYRESIPNSKNTSRCWIK